MIGSSLVVFAALLPLVLSVEVNCPCGWQIKDRSERYTNRLYNDFSQYSSATDLVSNPKANDFTSQWVINGYEVASDNLAMSHNQQFNPYSIALSGGYLTMEQLAYSQADANANKPVNIAGIQTKDLDILHGSFRTVFKITGATGGAVGSFFWYHNDSSEFDIETVTGGNSIVNNTINYTSHPSTYVNGTPIANATLSVPFTAYDVFNTHRFDCTSRGAEYFLNDQLMHEDHHNIPRYPGSVQLNLWANGNKFWSGVPSTTDVTMSVQQILVYYNTSEADDGTDSSWTSVCAKAGGPGNDTICMEGESSPISSTSGLSNTTGGSFSSLGSGGSGSSSRNTATISYHQCAVMWFTAGALLMTACVFSLY